MKTSPLVRVQLHSPLVDICRSVIWFQIDTLVVHLVGFAKLLLVGQGLKSCIAPHLITSQIAKCTAKKKRDKC